MALGKSNTNLRQVEETSPTTAAAPTGTPTGTSTTTGAPRGLLPRSSTRRGGARTPHAPRRRRSGEAQPPHARRHPPNTAARRPLRPRGLLRPTAPRPPGDVHFDRLSLLERIVLGRPEVRQRGVGLLLHLGVQRAGRVRVLVCACMCECECVCVCVCVYQFVRQTESVRVWVSA